MARELNKKKLSKSILEMKFMKRTKEKVEKELEDNEGQEMYSHAITAEMKQATDLLITDSGVASCLGLRCGRRSYRGINVEIEKLMALEEPTTKEDVESEKQISDKEMAAFYNPLVNVMAKKFNNVKGKHKRFALSDDENEFSKYEPKTKRNKL